MPTGTLRRDRSDDAARAALAAAGLRALGDDTRLAIARLLVEGAFNVGEVQEVFAIGQSTASRHLKLLCDAGLCEGRKEGRLVWYQWATTLTPAQEALRAFVREHCAPLDADARNRLHTVYEERSERSRRYFDGPAAEAMVTGRDVFPNVDVVDRMIARLPACRLVADVGTGTGRLLSALRDRAARVVGVDRSPRMLEVAGRRLRESGIDGIELRLGMLEHLPLADGEADAVVAHLVLHHVSVPEQVLGELRRVLRPGGTLVVGDYLPHGEEALRSKLADQWLGFEPRRFARMLQAAGFTEVVVEVVPGSGGVLGMFVAAAKAPTALKAGPADRTDDAPAEVPVRRRAATPSAAHRRTKRHARKR